MSITYDVIKDDTFDSIARKQYGTEQQSGFLARANPGVSQPLTPGTSLVVPRLPSAPRDVLQRAPADNPNEVALSIEGERFRFWTQIRIRRSMDAMDVIEFDAPFDSGAPGFREKFRPFRYQDVEVTIGGAPLFTGTMITPNPVLESSKKVISIECYSLPGVLNDCNAPASAYPLEFSNQVLRDIAVRLAESFGVGVQFNDPPGAVFSRVAADPNKKILAFLIELARQRNLVISSTPRGELLFQRSVETGNPVALLSQGSSPLESVTPQFNGQNFYSHVTGLEPTIVGLKGSQFTVKNTSLSGVIRPFTFVVQDTVNADVKTAVEAKAARMFANVATYVLKVATWRDPTGNLWEPNTTVQVFAPDAMVYSEYEFIIRSVEFLRTPLSEQATLTLVLPGSFSGQLPEDLPWD